MFKRIIALGIILSLVIPSSIYRYANVEAHGVDESRARGLSNAYGNGQSNGNAYGVGKAQGNAHAYGHDKDRSDKNNRGNGGRGDDDWDDDDWDDWDANDKNNRGRWHDKDKDRGRWGNRSISLVQMQHMDFGMLPSGGKRCVLKSNQNLVGDCIGNGILGEIEVTGKPFYAYNVIVRDLGWKQNRRLTPKLKRQDYYLDRHGRDIIFVRGIVEFIPGKKQRPGQANFTYIITVNYQ